jgi:hypothetical protein
VYSVQSRETFALGTVGTEGVRTPIGYHYHNSITRLPPNPRRWVYPIGSAVCRTNAQFEFSKAGRPRIDCIRISFFFFHVPFDAFHPVIFFHPKLMERRARWAHRIHPTLNLKLLTRVIFNLGGKVLLRTTKYVHSMGVRTPVSRPLLDTCGQTGCAVLLPAYVWSISDALQRWKRGEEENYIGDYSDQRSGASVYTRCCQSSETGWRASRLEA